MAKSGQQCEWRPNKLNFLFSQCPGGNYTNNISSGGLVLQRAVVNCYLVPVGTGCLVQFIFEEHLKPPCHTRWHSLVPDLHKNGLLLARMWHEVTGFCFAPSSESLWSLLGCVLFCRAVGLYCPHDTGAQLHITSWVFIINCSYFKSVWKKQAFFYN